MNTKEDYIKRKKHALKLCKALIASGGLDYKQKQDVLKITKELKRVITY